MKHLLVVVLMLGGCLVATAQNPPEKAQPAVTLEQLQSRLSQLEKAKDQAMANVNAFVGAIEETKHWIELLMPRPDPPKEKPVKAEPPKGK